jgi:integrase
VTLPRLRTRALAWVTDTRRLLKREHGIGWTISQEGSRVKLCWRDADGSRRLRVLPIPWDASAPTAILSAVAETRRLMSDPSLSFADAVAAAVRTGEELLRPADQRAADWPTIATAYVATRADLRPSTLRDTRHRVARAVATLSSPARPRDGRELLQAYAAQHFAACPPGGQGRKRQLLEVAALLTFAVEHCGAPSRWLPPPAANREALIGHRGEHRGPTLPISSRDLAALLDSLEARGRGELLLAVRLVGLFGLRPAELGALRVEGGRLYIGGHVKRNWRTLKTPKPPRLVLPLDLPGREGEGASAAALFASGLVQLPVAIRNATALGDFRAVGQGFAQLLRRDPCWQALAEASPGLTPYGLRHAYAWRGHKGYTRSLPVRDLAALMGHGPATHHRHYGAWVNEDGLVESVARLTGTEAPMALPVVS